jgi:hypothetical protein
MKKTKPSPIPTIQPNSSTRPFSFFLSRPNSLPRPVSNQPAHLPLSLTLSLTGGAHPSGSPLTSSQLPSLPVQRRPHCPAPPTRLPASLPLLLQCVATHSAISQPSPPRNRRAPSAAAINGWAPTDPAPPPWPRPFPFPLRPIKGQQDLLSTLHRSPELLHSSTAPPPELTTGAPTSRWISSPAPTFAVLRPPVRSPPSPLSSGASPVFFRAPELFPGVAPASPPPPV